MTMNRGVLHPDKVDLVAYMPEADEWLVVIEELGEWRAIPRAAMLLQEKINGYVSFIRGGQMARLYPESIGKPVRIRLSCSHRPDPDSQRLIERAVEWLAERAIGFEISLLACDCDASPSQ